MGNCFGCLKKFRKSSAVNTKKVTLLVLGLDNAGKTTVVKRLTREPVDEVLATVGFASYELQHRGCNVSIYDVGGGPKIRDIWQQYYADVHGIIYVVDSSDVIRMDESRRVLHKVLKDRRAAGKPVLLLANKQDLPDALDEIDVVERLRLEALVNQQKCPTLVELCSAKTSPKKDDLGINNGFKWLIRNISKDYPMLNNRVLVDVAEQDEVERKAMDEKRKRLEGLVRNHENGQVPVVANGDTTEAEDEGDPFKPISQLIVKSQVNTALDKRKPIQLPRVPAVAIDDDSDDDDLQTAAVASRSSHSEQFFNTTDWGSTEGLLDKNKMVSSETFLQRPKSSGAIDLPTKKSKKKRKKKRLRLKNNKTVPSADVPNDKPTSVGPIPAIFDPAYHTEVTVLTNQNGGPPKQSSSQNNKEVILSVTAL